MGAKKLIESLKKLRKEYAQERMHLKTGHSVQTSKLGTLRQSIARTQTVLTEKNNPKAS